MVRRPRSSAGRLPKATLAASSVAVLTTSSGAETAREDAASSRGAFTQALLEAVPTLTGRAQTTGIEARSEGGLFAAAL